MKSFIRKQLILGVVFLLLVSLFIGYISHQLNKTQAYMLGTPQCYYQVSDQTSFIEGLLNAYEFDVNGMIANPRSFVPSDVDNNPLRKTIEERLESLVVNSKSCETAYDAIGSDLDRLKKSLRDIAVATTGLIEAFSSKDPKNQTLINVGNFTGIIQSSQVSATNYTSQIKKTLASKTSMGTKKQFFTESRFALLVLMFVCIVFCAILVIKSYMVSRFILGTKKAVLKINKDGFSAKDVSSSISTPKDAELFELYDSVTSIATMIENEFGEQKRKIYVLDDDLSRHKVISTYTTGIINALQDGIMVTDDLLKVSFINASFEKFWRVKRTSVIDQDAKELPFIRLVDGWKDGLSKALYSSLSGAKFVTFEGEYRLSEKATAQKVTFYILPLKDERGKNIIGTVTVTRPAKE